MNVSGITRVQLEEIIVHWERFKNAYFWTPPQSAGGRRSEEKHQYRKIDFGVGDNHVYIEIKITCSCKNYYVTREVYLDGEGKKPQGLRYLKKILREGVFLND